MARINEGTQRDFLHEKWFLTSLIEPFEEVTKAVDEVSSVNVVCMV